LIFSVGFDTLGPIKLEIYKRSFGISCVASLPGAHGTMQLSSVTVENNVLGGITGRVAMVDNNLN